MHGGFPFTSISLSLSLSLSFCLLCVNSADSSDATFICPALYAREYTKIVSLNRNKRRSTPVSLSLSLSLSLSPSPSLIRHITPRASNSCRAARARAKMKPSSTAAFLLLSLPLPSPRALCSFQFYRALSAAIPSTMAEDRISISSAIARAARCAGCAAARSI